MNRAKIGAAKKKHGASVEAEWVAAMCRIAKRDRALYLEILDDVRKQVARKLRQGNARAKAARS